MTFRQDHSMEGIPPDALELYRILNQASYREFQEHGDLFAEHVRLSHEAIIDASRRRLWLPDTYGKVLILGAGNCDDLPVGQLADDCQVTLVDIDTTRSQQVAEGLSSEQAQRVDVIAADITGVVGWLATATNLAIENHPTYEGFVDTMSETLWEIGAAAAPPDLGQGYDLVCSHLVTSQLAVGPELYMSQKIRERYSIDFPQGGMDDGLAAACEELTTELQLAHVQQLASLAGSGVVHFADTFVRYVGDVPIGMVADEVLDDMQETFSVVQHWTPWRWRNEGPHPTEVSASILRPNLTS